MSDDDVLRRRLAASTERLQQVLSKHTAAEQAGLLAIVFGSSASAVAVAAHQAGARQVVQGLREVIESVEDSYSDDTNEVLAAWLDRVEESLPDE